MLAELAAVRRQAAAARDARRCCYRTLAITSALYLTFAALLIALAT